MYKDDPTGRHDLAGKAVKFYPSARSLAEARSQSAAVVHHSIQARKENANRALGVDLKK